jgi:flagellar hook-length control protein FliK
VAPTETLGISRPEGLPAAHGSATSTAPAAAALSTPVDVRTPGWHEAFANRVQWLVDSDVNEARIRLHPAELGAVDVEISLIDDKTYVQLTTATASARDELSQSLPRLRELFASSGLELGGASVRDGRDSQQPFGRGDGPAAPSPRYFAPFAELAGETPAALLSRPLGRIDVFA